MGYVVILDSVSGEEIARFGSAVDRDNKGPVVGISPNGKTLLVSSSDAQTAALLSVTDGRIVQSFDGYMRGGVRATFSPNGSRVITASLGRDSVTYDVWEASSGESLIKIPLSLYRSYNAYFATFSPDGMTAVTGGTGSDYLKTTPPRLWNAATGDYLRTFAGHHEGAVTSVAHSPAGSRLVTAGVDGIVSQWDVPNAEFIRSFGGPEDIVASVAYSPEGARVAAGSWDGTVRIWEVDTGKELAILARLPGGAVNAVAFAPDGRTILFGGWDRSARIISAEGGRTVQVFPGHVGPVNSVAFGPDGRKAATAGDTVRLWDVASGQLIKVFSGHTGIVNSVAFSPAGDRLVTGGNDGTALVWTIGDTEPAGQIRVERSGGGAVVLTWRTEAGSPAVVLEQSFNLLPGSWQTVPTPVPGRHELDPTTAAATFLRLGPKVP